MLAKQSRASARVSGESVEPNRADIILNLLRAARTDNRARHGRVRQRPCDRQLPDGLAMPCRDGTQPLDEGEVLRELGFLIERVPLPPVVGSDTGLVECAGENAALHGAVDDNALFRLPRRRAVSPALRRGAAGCREAEGESICPSASQRRIVFRVEIVYAEEPRFALR